MEGLRGSKKGQNGSDRKLQTETQPEVRASWGRGPLLSPALFLEIERWAFGLALQVCGCDRDLRETQNSGERLRAHPGDQVQQGWDEQITAGP